MTVMGVKSLLSVAAAIVYVNDDLFFYERVIGIRYCTVRNVLLCWVAADLHVSASRSFDRNGLNDCCTSDGRAINFQFIRKCE